MHTLLYLRMEGFLTKRAMKSGRNWKRRYFVLKNNALAYYDGKPLDEDSGLKPKGLVELTSNSVVRISPVNREFAFEVVTKPQVLCVSADSKSSLNQWKEAITDVIDSLKRNKNDRPDEERRGWLVKRAVRSGRNWKKRWFILRNSRLCYYEQPPSGPAIRPKGLLEVNDNTIVKPSVASYGSLLRGGKKNVFIIQNKDQTLHMSADSIDEMFLWISTVQKIVFRKQGITDPEALKVALWLYEKDLVKFCRCVVVIMCLNTFDKIKSIDSEQEQIIFKTVRATMAEARSFSSALKEIQTVTGPRKISQSKPVEGFSARRSILRTSIPDIAPPPPLPEEELEELMEIEHRAYTWGANSEMELGTGDITNSISTPTSVRALKNKNEPSRIFAGTGLMLAITKKDGRLFSWGSGPLGLGEEQQQSGRPYLINALRKVRIVNVSIGAMHVGVLSIDRNIYTWGHGDEGQLGHGKGCLLLHEPEMLPTIGAEHGEPIVSLSCGPDHTLVVNEDGEVLSFGLGKHGRLGLGSESNVFMPKKLETIFDTQVVRVATGSSFSMALTCDSCFWWGKMGSNAGPQVPMRLESFDERCIDEIYAGGSTAMFLVGLTSDKDEGAIIPSSVYSMGDDCLGHSTTGSSKLIPSRIDALEHHGVVMLSVGIDHAAALCDDGRLLLWGRDQYGQLGNGYKVDTNAPHGCISVAYYKYAWVSCGSKCTATICEFDPFYDDEVDLDGNLYDAGTTMAPPPPPEECIFTQESNEEEMEKIMESLAALTGVEVEEALPEGSRRIDDKWLEHTDPNTGKMYYEDESNGTVQWQKPSL